LIVLFFYELKYGLKSICCSVGFDHDVGIIGWKSFVLVW